MPEIVLLNLCLFIVDHVKCPCLRTDLSESKKPLGFHSEHNRRAKKTEFHLRSGMFPTTLPPPAEFYSPPLGQRREIVLDTLVCRCLSRCCSCSSLLYPGGLTLKSRSLTIARNSFLLSSQ